MNRLRLVLRHELRQFSGQFRTGVNLSDRWRPGGPSGRPACRRGCVAAPVQISTVDAIHELLATPAAVEKLGARSIRFEEA